MADATQTPIKAAIEALGAYLLEEMASLEKVIYEFPAANSLLKYPSLSITVLKPQFTPLDPYILAQSDVAVPDPDSPLLVTKYVVGAYDLTLQLDLWCRDKVERFNLLEEFFTAMNPDIIPPGLSLELTNYHDDIWCRYAYTGYELGEESEGSSQRAEWRARINVLANTRAVRTKTEFVMETFETTLTTPKVIAEE